MIKQIYLLFFIVLFSTPVFAENRELFKTVQMKAAAGELSSIMEMGRRYAKGIDVKRDDEEALKWYKQALAKRYSPAYVFFGDAYYYGDRIDTLAIDYQKAYDFYKKAGATGDMQASYMAGVIAFYGKGMNVDYVSAYKDFNEACPKEIYACVYLGTMLRYGLGVNKDEKQAEHYFSFQENAKTDTIAANNAEAYFNRGRRLIAKTPDNAVDVLLKSGEDGNKDAAYLARLIILNDDEAYKNSNSGVDIIKEEATKGDVLAMNRLGEIYYDGRLLPKDTAVAKKWFLKATDKGDVIASRNLGLIAINDEKDTINALRWLSNAGEGGDGVSAYYVGQIYNSDDILKNQDKAEEWFLKSAKLGEEKSQAIVGAMYVTGTKNLKKDLSNAYAWLSLAAKGFSGKEKEKINETAMILKTHLNEQELEKANKIIIKYQ